MDNPSQHGAWLAERPPTIEGHSARAWIITAHPQHPDETASVAAWLLYMPGAHPFWAYWMLSVVHLRNIEGQSRPAIKHHDDATHELIVLTLNPEHAPPDPARWDHVHYLEPFDQVIQFTVPTDADAAKLLELAVRRCCDGYLSPDQDYRDVWRRAVAETAAHARGEH
jgi:hypothetical protein